MPTPSSTASCTTPIASISPGTACAGPDQYQPERIDPKFTSRQNPTASRTPQAGDIMSEQRATSSRNDRATSSESAHADSDGSRPPFRDDLAHHSDLISLGVPR